MERVCRFSLFPLQWLLILTICSWFSSLLTPQFSLSYCQKFVPVSLGSLALGGSCSFSWWQQPWPLLLPRLFKMKRQEDWQQGWTRCIQQLIVTDPQRPKRASRGQLLWPLCKGGLVRGGCSAELQKLWIRKHNNISQLLQSTSLFNQSHNEWFALVSNDNFSSFSLCLLSLAVALSTALPRWVWHHVLHTISSDSWLVGSPHHVHVCHTKAFYWRTWNGTQYSGCVSPVLSSGEDTLHLTYCNAWPA